jgi:hypothetical protein
MDNHKLITISIFFAFLKYKKDAIFFLFFYKNMLGKLLGFGRMHEETFFLFLFFFERGNYFKVF